MSKPISESKFQEIKAIFARLDAEQAARRKVYRVHLNKYSSILVMAESELSAQLQAATLLRLCGIDAFPWEFEAIEMKEAA